MPTLKQVQNQVHRLRQPSSSPFTDVDFKIYCSDNVQQTGRHDSFVLGWSFTDSENFFVLWTTPHLLDLQKSQELLQVTVFRGLIGLGLRVLSAQFCHV